MGGELEEFYATIGLAVSELRGTRENNYSLARRIYSLNNQLTVAIQALLHLKVEHPGISADLIIDKALDEIKRIKREDE